MPNIDELKSLVRDLRSQGVSDEEIRKTLLEMDVEPSLVNDLLGGSSPPLEVTTPENPPQEPAPPEGGDIPVVPPLPATPPEEPPSPVEHLPSLETAEKVDSLHRKVDSLHQNVARRDDIAIIKEEIAELRADLRDVKAALKAVQKLLQEILNTERSILLDLYEKAKKK